MTKLQIDSTVDDGPTDLRRRTRRRTSVIVVSLIVVTVVIVGLLLVIPLFKSPSQLAADALPPVPLPVTARVEKKQLVTQVVMRGVVLPGPSFSLKASDALVSLAPVVTKTPVGNGGAIAIGAVVVEYNGEPLVAMNWGFPAYRDIYLGDNGPDVEQLQRTLASLGYATGKNGVFDKATAIALEQYYLGIGYQVPMVSKSAPSGRSSTGINASDGQPNTVEGVPEGSIYFPSAGVVMIPRNEVTVSSLGVEVGSKITSDSRLMSLDGGQNVTVGSTTPERAAVLKEGDIAVLADTSSNETFSLVVKSVGKATSPVPGLGDGIRVDLKFKDASKVAPVTASGRTLKLTIATGDSSDAVLAVPISAVFSDASGESFVSTIVGGEQRRVPINVGTVVDGWAQVSPSGVHVLAEGAEVIVGSNYSQ